MDTVLVAIASPQALKLSADHMTTIMSACKIEGDLNWLSPDEAFEVTFATPDGFDARQTEDIARNALDGLPIDIAFVPAENRKKMLLVADMDSTMIQQECIDELADIAGVGEQVKQITARTMAGELNFQDSLRQRLALLKGLPEKVIGDVIAERITFTPGGRALVQTMKANEAFTAVLSGGFTHFTGYVAKMLGFDDNQANVLEIEDGKLLGTAIEPIMDQDQKKRSLATLTMMNGFNFGQTLAVGDGANDLPMLQRSSMGVALHAKPVVRDGARYRIDHCDLTALLYLQGYKRAEFVTGGKGQAGVAITTS